MTITFCIAFSGRPLLILAATLILTASGASIAKEISGQRVSNARGDVLGEFAGLTTVRTPEGSYSSAALTLTRTDYILPLNFRGNTGLFSEAYFDEPDCNGNEYLLPQTSDQSMAPLPGVIYESIATGELRFIERFAATQSVDVRSRMYFDTTYTPVCDSYNATLEVLTTFYNEPETTGWDNEPGTVGTIALSTDQPRKQKRTTLFSGGSSGLDADSTTFPNEQECSPSCLWEDVGNNVCEIACYVDACSYDAGDCDNEPLDEIQNQLDQMCSPGCFKEEMGDGFCDTACNNAACNFDLNDCKVD